MEFFLLSPFLILAPALFFGYFFLISRKITNAITSVLWLLYWYYEAFYITMTCPSNCIRIDVLLIWPILLIFTIFSLVKVAPYLQKTLKKTTAIPTSTKLLFAITVLLCLTIGYFWGYSQKGKDMMNFKRGLYMKDIKMKPSRVENKMKPNNNIEIESID